MFKARKSRFTCNASGKLGKQASAAQLIRETLTRHARDIWRVTAALQIPRTPYG